MKTVKHNKLYQRESLANRHTISSHVCGLAPCLLLNYANAVQFLKSVCVLSPLLWAAGFSTIPSEGGEALYKNQKNQRRTHFSPRGGRQQRSAGTPTNSPLEESARAGEAGLAADAGTGSNHGFAKHSSGGHSIP